MSLYTLSRFFFILIGLLLFLNDEERIRVENEESLGTEGGTEGGTGSCCFLSNIGEVCARSGYSYCLVIFGLYYS